MANLPSPAGTRSASPRRAGRPRILVAGLGNLLLSDDGVGVHAVRELQKDVPRGVTAAEVGTAVLFALDLFEKADRVLAIDAMEAGGPPGEVYVFGLDDVENPAVKPSLHDFGLRSAFEFLPGHRPEVVVIGVEPGVIGYGLELSAAVRSALPRVVAEARRIIDGW
jgi:hydrogenase maturation protease